MLSRMYPPPGSDAEHARRQTRLSVLLARVLIQIERHDQDYDQRYPLVWLALAYATQLGFAAGVRIDSEVPDWPCVYIELPTGQVSWHMPAHGQEWDQHDTATKYARCREYAAIHGE